MPPDENPQPPLSPEELALHQLNRLRKRVPKFRGVEPVGDGTWRAQIRNNTGWREIGIYPSCGKAWAAYQRAPKYSHRDPVESEATVNRLLRMAESYPIQMTVEASLWGSTMDTRSRDWQTALNYTDDYESRGKK
jgi:hypothetical protein